MFRNKDLMKPGRKVVFTTDIIDYGLCEDGFPPSLEAKIGTTAIVREQQNIPLEVTLPSGKHLFNIADNEVCGVLRWNLNHPSAQVEDE